MLIEHCQLMSLPLEVQQAQRSFPFTGSRGEPSSATPAQPASRQKGERERVLLLSTPGEREFEHARPSNSTSIFRPTPESRIKRAAERGACRGKERCVGGSRLGFGCSAIQSADRGTFAKAGNNRTDGGQSLTT